MRALTRQAARAPVTPAIEVHGSDSEEEPPLAATVSANPARPLSLFSCLPIAHGWTRLEGRPDAHFQLDVNPRPAHRRRLNEMAPHIDQLVAPPHGPPNAASTPSTANAVPTPRLQPAPFPLALPSLPALVAPAPVLATAQPRVQAQVAHLALMDTQFIERSPQPGHPRYTAAQRHRACVTTAQITLEARSFYLQRAIPEGRPETARAPGR